MRKYILPILFVFVMIFFAFSVYNYSKDSNKNQVSDNGFKGTLSTEKFNSNPSNPDFTTDDLNGKTGVGIKTSSGAGSGSSGIAGSENSNNYVPPEERRNETSCVLIRPGNLPNVNCFVNYIKKDSVSLKIENQLGEDIGIGLDLSSCSPKLQDFIKNNEQKTFVFSCNNNEYFNQEILITYFLTGNGTVSIGGFVSGYV